MKDRGFSYTPLPPADAVQSNIDVHLIDPTYAARHAGELKSFGLNLTVKTVRDYISFSRLTDKKTVITESAQQHAESAALDGDQQTPGCGAIATEAVGKWSLDQVYEEYGDSVAQELSNLQSDKRFEALDAKFADCAASKAISIRTILNPYVTLQQTLLNVLTTARVAGKLTTDSDIAAVVAKSVEVDATEFGGYQACVLPLQSALKPIFNDYFSP